MKFSLQRLVSQTLAEAEHRVKLAEEDQEKKEEKKDGSPAKSTSSESGALERNEEGVSEKTATVFVEKLANAVAYLNAHYLAKEAEGTSETVGAGKGTGALETNLGSPTPGEQSQTFGQAKHDQPPTSPGSDVKSPGQVNPATALETDINNPPGGSEDWTNKNIEHQAAAKGEALKGLINKARNFAGSRASAAGEAVSHLRGAASKGNTLKDRAVQVGKAIAKSPELAAAGVLGTAGAAKGVHAVVKGGKKDTTKTAQVERILGIMNKLAEDAINPAHIGAAVTNPHQSSPEGVSQSEEAVPSQPGEVNKQDSLISSNQAAIDYTKQQAKAVPKARMGEVIEEPAQKKSTDPVLHQNLDATGEAGVKISSAQARAAGLALLTKIAEEGAQEEATPEQKERAQKLHELLQAKEKESQGMGASEPSMPLGGGF